MNCQTAQECLLRRLDEALPSALDRELEDHLRTCSVCREEQRLLAESWDLLDDYPAPAPSADFTAQVLAKARSAAAKPAPARRFFVLPRLIRLAACVAILGLGIWSWQRWQGRGTPDEALIRDLDLYENLDLLEDLDLLAELDLVSDWAKE